MKNKTILLILSAVFLNTVSTESHAESPVVRHIKNCPTKLSSQDLEKISVAGSKDHPYPIGNLVSIKQFSVGVRAYQDVNVHTGMDLAKSFVATGKTMDAVDSHIPTNCAYVFYSRARDAGGEIKTNRVVIEFAPIAYKKPMIKPAQKAHSSESSADAFPRPPSDMAPLPPHGVIPPQPLDMGPLPRAPMPLPEGVRPYAGNRVAPPVPPRR